VLIENCVFNTGDDCIAIKSGRNGDGRRVNVAAENIIIRGCSMRDGHGGVTIGSEISGGCKNVFVENCVMDSPQLERAIRFKSNATRGGVIENIFVRNVKVGQVSKAVVAVEFRYEEGEKGDFPPVVRHVAIEHLTSASSPRALSLEGIPNGTIDDIRIDHCEFKHVGAPDLVEYTTRLVRTDVNGTTITAKAGPQ
jgi:polygalacturonase